MNHELFEALITIPMFDQFLELDKKFICDIMSRLGPTETTSIGGTMAFEGDSIEVVSIEALATMSIVLRSPRPKPTPMRETQKLKQDKQKRSVPMRESS